MREPASRKGMSDNISLAEQREFADLESENETYIVDMFSYVQTDRHGHNESHKQICMFITRAEESNRTGFLQEEKTRLGMITVHSDIFTWRKTKAASTLFAKLEMGDFQAVKTVDRRKLDEMRLPEKITYTLPPCNASTMKIVAKLSSENTGVTLLETEQLNVQLSMLPLREPKPGVEHDHYDHIVSQPTESSSISDDDELLQTT